jgi:hypothetical protein
MEQTKRKELAPNAHAGLPTMRAVLPSTTTGAFYRSTPLRSQNYPVKMPPRKLRWRAFSNQHSNEIEYGNGKRMNGRNPRVQVSVF